MKVENSFSADTWIWPPYILSVKIISRPFRPYFTCRKKGSVPIIFIWADEIPTHVFTQRKPPIHKPRETAVNIFPINLPIYTSNSKIKVLQCWKRPPVSDQELQFSQSFPKRLPPSTLKKLLLISSTA